MRLNGRNPVQHRSVEWVFWMGSAGALLLVVLVAIAKPQPSQSAQVMDALGANRPGDRF